MGMERIRPPTEYFRNVRQISAARFLLIRKGEDHDLKCKEIFFYTAAVSPRSACCHFNRDFRCAVHNLVTAFAEVGQQEITLPQLSEVVCKSYIVYDRTKGEILISQNPDQKIYPASMTKIMTAALALDNLATDQILTVSQSAMNATTPNSSLMGLQVGEEISVNELLYGLLLPSGNDAANVLAEAIVTATGYTDPVNPLRSKLDLFSDLMNQKVTELGLLNTHFVNANGLHDDNHYTTASDLAIIFNYAVDHADFRTAISSPTHVFK